MFWFILLVVSILIISISFVLNKKTQIDGSILEVFCGFGIICLVICVIVISLGFGISIGDKQNMKMKLYTVNNSYKAYINLKGSLKESNKTIDTVNLSYNTKCQELYIEVLGQINDYNNDLNFRFVIQDYKFWTICFNYYEPEKYHLLNVDNYK